MEEGTKRTVPITLEELQLEIYHPPPSDHPLFADPSSPGPASLSFVPWTIQQPMEKSNHDNVARPPASGQPLHPPSYPIASYLDLRRKQNLAWACDRLNKGNEQFYLDSTKADQFYSEGLNLVPDHIDLLVAQAKLWIQRRQRPQAGKVQLQSRVLHLDPNHKEAKELLNRMERQEAARRSVAPKRLPQTRETSVYQDVLMERNLALDSLNLLEDEVEVKIESITSSRRDRKDSKKKKKKSKSRKDYSSRKKRDKKKRRRKRRREDSSSDEDDESSTSDEESTHANDNNGESRRDRSRGRDGHRRHHKRKRHRRRQDSNESNSLSDDSEVAEVAPKAATGGASCNGDANEEKDDDQPSSVQDSKHSSRRHHKRRRSSHKSSNKHKLNTLHGSSDTTPMAKEDDKTPCANSD